MRRLATGLIVWAAAQANSAGAAAAKDVWIDWSSDRGAHRTYAADGLKLTFDLRPGRTKDSPVPVLTVSSPDRTPLTVEGVPGWEGVAAKVGVLRLDAASPLPQVLFMTYSGGAHCCTDLEVIIATADGWRAQTLAYDGSPGKDIVEQIGPGGRQIVIDDGGFDYAYASHAGSHPVKRIYGVRAGKLLDETGERRFNGPARDGEADARQRCFTSIERNGSCAAYIADASLTGHHAYAWAEMLAHYDRDVAQRDNGCLIPEPAGGCPRDQALDFKDFPHALAWKLWRLGYWPPAPAFECAQPTCPPPWPATPPP